MMMKKAVLALALAAPATAFTPQKSSVRSPNVDQNAVAVPLSTSQSLTPELPAKDQWIAKLDYEGFGKEVSALGKRILSEEKGESVEHLGKIVRWRNIAGIVGLATVWTTPNPLTVVALSTWTYASWTMIAHHTCHGGYNRMDAGKFNSRGFALGSVSRRVKDWCDWMLPEAWNVEHNRLHHYRLNEGSDPDLVQRNLQFIRESRMPKPFKYAICAFLFSIWKFAYYAPNTYKELKQLEYKNSGKDWPENYEPEEPLTLGRLIIPQSPSDRAVRKIVKPFSFFVDVMAPFFVSRFVLLPLPFLFFSKALAMNALINMVAAEIFTNLHSFATIVTNHCGDDLYTFDDAVKPRSPSFYVRQIIGSANYKGGNDVLDFSQGFLNYQIEHHVWPDLSMLQYQKAAPQLKAICNKYGVPYVEESVFHRVKKTIDIVTGDTSMRVFPTAYEPSKDKTQKLTWASSNGSIDGDDKV